MDEFLNQGHEYILHDLSGSLLKTNYQRFHMSNKQAYQFWYKLYAISPIRRAEYLSHRMLIVHHDLR